jgi:hypothetical protein
MLKEAFKEFRNTRLIRTRGRRCSEVVIETAFKRSTRGAFRTKLSDPELDQVCNFYRFIVTITDRIYCQNVDKR